MRKRDELLLELGPGDLEHGSREKITRLEAAGELSSGELDAELRYLRAISARKVALPSDAYFARTRQKIFARVEVSPISIWSRFKALVIPATIKPIPVILTGTAAVLLIAIVTSMLYVLPMRKTEEQLAYGPHQSIGQTYSQHVAGLDEAVISHEDLVKMREILVMSTAILGSPSSLSRSQALLGGSSRL